MNRKETLHTAETCVCGQREQDYGSPENNFEVIAQYWEVYLRNRCICEGLGLCVRPEDVANLMTLLKMGRITTGGPKADNYVDACGYMACAAEIATSRILTSNTPGVPDGEYRIGECAAESEIDPIEDEQTETHEQLVERAENKRREVCDSSSRKCDTCKIASQNNGKWMYCGYLVEQYPQLALDLMQEKVGE